MRSSISIATAISVGLIVSGCGLAPSDICEMPQNRQFWQGLNVKWRGPIIEIEENHGGGIWFANRDCGMSVEIDRATVPTLFRPKGGKFGFVAVADFDVEGRLILKGDQILLSASSLKQRSAWQADQDDDFEKVWEALNP